MNSFVGIVNLNYDISKNIDILERMSLKLNGNAKEKFVREHISFASEDFYEGDENTYSIILNGEIYNKYEIKELLIRAKYNFYGDSTEEILLKAFMHFGEDIFSRLNGAFSFIIWNNKTEEIYLVRDHFGIKPLYYARVNNSLIFSSAIAPILEYPEVKTTIDEIGIAEIFGLRTSSYNRKDCI